MTIETSGIKDFQLSILLYLKNTSCVYAMKVICLEIFAKITEYRVTSDIIYYVYNSKHLFNNMLAYDIISPITLFNTEGSSSTGF